MTKITFRKVPHSRVTDLDFNNIPFGRVFSDHMFIADYKDGKWQDHRIVPFGYMQMHPAMMTLHYGQACFEGMKAMKKTDGTPVFFRPEDNAKRLNYSAKRLCMPEFPVPDFMEALHALVALDRNWIPENEDSALYLRPFMFATDEYIGVKPSDTYRMVIFTCPVGAYYSNPVKLLTDQKYIRAAEGGTGDAKAAGNYAGSLYPAKLAKEQGYDQVLWLDAREFKYIQEAGTMNLFFVIGDTVVTPSTTGTILEGITRHSCIEILKSNGIKVEERMLSIDEIVEAHLAGQLLECFGTGTAAVIAPVSEIKHEDTVMPLPQPYSGKIGAMLKAQINGLRKGTVEDTFGWIEEVKIGTPVTV